MGQYTVHPEALEAYAAVIEAQREQITALRTALAGVHVTGGAFGKLPDSDELHSSYDGHASAAQQNCQDLFDVLEHAAQGLRDNARQYRQAEHDTSSGMGGGV